MGHHYIPQFYLRGFAIGDEIWAHDRIANRSFQSQPKTVAHETAMYPEEIEQYFANTIEAPAKPVIEKIRNREPITSGDKEALAKYIVALWKRVPKGRERVKNLMPGVAESVRDDLKKELIHAAQSNPALAQVADAKLDEIDEIIARHKEDPPQEIWHRNLYVEGSPNVVDSLLSMEWRFLYSDNYQFLTCDNPVFYFEHEGIGKPTLEVTLPISSSLALWANRRTEPTGIYLKATQVAIRELNRRTAHNATRFLFSAFNETWILPFARKPNHRLTRLL